MNVQALLDELAQRSGVLGASLAIAHGGEIEEYAIGRMRIDDDAQVTPETPFLVGSTSKSFTATLLAQLVDDGRVGFDDPVVRHLPALKLNGERASDLLTIRHLLSHTSGIDNGPYADHDDGDDAVERYVASLVDVPISHAPGERFGYSNAAYVIAGRVVEVITGSTWDDALRDRLLRPAGLDSSFTSWGPGDPRVARGHRRAEDGDLVVAPKFSVAGRAMGPTGSTLCCTAADLVRFGIVHANGGVAPNGTKVLSVDSVDAMQELRTTLPEGSMVAKAWTAGFLVDEWSGAHVFGHTGHTMGSGSYLRFLPEHDTVIALLFNSPGDATLFHELTSTLAGELGLRTADPWVRIEPDLDIELASYTGTYRVMGEAVEIVAEDGGLRLVGADDFAARTGLGRILRPATRSVFGSADSGQYTVAPPDGALAPDIIFDSFDPDGRPRFALATVFLCPRLAP